MGSRRELLPVLIDMACGLAFIKLHALLFVLHRLEQKLRLLLAHLPFLLRLGRRSLGRLGIFIRLLVAGAFYVARWFLVRR